MRVEDVEAVIVAAAVVAVAIAIHCVLVVVVLIVIVVVTTDLVLEFKGTRFVKAVVAVVCSSGSTQ